MQDRVCDIRICDFLTLWNLLSCRHCQIFCFFLCERKKIVVSLNDFNLKPRQVFVRASLSFCPTCFPMLIKNSIYLGFSFCVPSLLHTHWLPHCTSKISLMHQRKESRLAPHFNAPCSCDCAQTMALFHILSLYNKLIAVYFHCVTIAFKEQVSTSSLISTCVFIIIIITIIIIMIHL